MSTPLTNRQIPSESILDLNGRQTYLGNSYIASTNVINVSVANYEVPFFVLLNPAANAAPQNISCFQNTRKLIVGTLGNSAIFRFYSNTTLLTSGSAITPVNLRSGSAKTSVMTAASQPTVTGVDQVQTVTTVPDVAGSLNNTYFLLSSINPSGVQKYWYMWFNVNSAGTDPAVASRSGIQVALATGATANAVATAMRSALNALTNDFVATGATNHVIITNVNPGACQLASDGAQPTGFAFANTTPGSSAFGSLVAILASSFVTSDSTILFVVDPGKSLLVTVETDTANTGIAAELVWYEI